MHRSIDRLWEKTCLQKRTNLNKFYFTNKKIFFLINWPLVGVVGPWQHNRPPHLQWSRESSNHWFKLAKKWLLKPIAVPKNILHSAKNICFGFGVKKKVYSLACHFMWLYTHLLDDIRPLRLFSAFNNTWDAFFSKICEEPLFLYLWKNACGWCVPPILLILCVIWA